ncbi:MAG: HAMP domain-containing protein, partial [Eubacteriales bacterium]|nr:HAMP domain-containing protein [Eubacteriales bacterium]
MRRINTYLHSFRFKIVFSAILFLIPAIILPTMWVSRIHTQELMALDEKQTAASFEIAKTNLQSLLTDASNAVNVVQTSKAVDDYLLGEFSSVADKALAKRDFDSAIESVLLMYPYITDILFLKEDNTLVGSSLEWHYTDEPSDHPLLQAENFKASLNSSKLQWFDSFDIHYLTQALNAVHDSIHYPSGHRICGIGRLRYTYSGNALDRNIIVLIAINELDVRQRFAHLISGEGDLSILSKNGKYISSADEALLDTYADFFHLIPQESDFGSFSHETENNGETRIIYSRMDSTDWLLIRSVPVSSYSVSERRLMMITLEIGLIVLTIISVLYAVWAKRLCRPLDKMTKALLAVSEGDLEMRLPVDPSAPVEIRLMTEQMNAMLESLNELILLNEANEQRKYILEMRSLQSQITPHFLFNTLTS